MCRFLFQLIISADEFFPRASRSANQRVESVVKMTVWFLTVTDVQYGEQTGLGTNV